MFRKEQRAGRLGERAAAGLTLPHVSMPHERSELLAGIPSSSSNRFILSAEFGIYFNLDFYSTLKSPSEWLNCLILALYIQDIKKERNSLV